MQIHEAFRFWKILAIWNAEEKTIFLEKKVVVLLIKVFYITVGPKVVHLLPICYSL